MQQRPRAIISDVRLCLPGRELERGLGDFGCEAEGGAEEFLGWEEEEGVSC